MDVDRIDAARPAKRVGIVTYFRNCNYGSSLQAFALQEVVRSLGYDARIIDYLDRSNPSNVAFRRRRVIQQAVCSLRAPIASWRLRTAGGHSRQQSEEKRRAFERFERERLNVYSEDYTFPSAFDAFVCGSDQVWNLAAPGLHEVFFLRFAPQEKRVAYAPSFGMESVPRYNRAQLGRFLSDFPFLSVREQSGVEIVSRLTGRSVSQVLDPVLLAGERFWEDLRESDAHPEPEKPYALAYFLSDNDDAVAEVAKEAAAHGETIVWIDAGVAPPSGVEASAPDPLEFVSLLAGASCVYTDSFHGFAFAAMMGAPFVLFNRNYEGGAGQATRIVSLLDMLYGQKGDAGLIRFSSKRCGSADVRMRLEAEREASLSYLSRALASACGDGSASMSSEARDDREA